MSPFSIFAMAASRLVILAEYLRILSSQLGLQLGEPFLHGCDFRQRFATVTHLAKDLQSEMKLFVQFRRSGRRTRIHLDLQRLREVVAIDGQLDLIRSRHYARTTRRAVALVFLGRGISTGAAPAQVPHEAMRAGGVLQHNRLGQPALGDRQGRMRLRLFWLADKAAHQFSACVGDFQLHLFARRTADSSRGWRRRAGSSPSVLRAAKASPGRHRYRYESLCRACRAERPMTAFAVPSAAAAVMSSRIQNERPCVATIRSSP